MITRRAYRQTVAMRLFANALAERPVRGMVLGFAAQDLVLGGVLLRDHQAADRARVWSEALTYLAAVSAVRGLAVEDCWFREHAADSSVPIAQDPEAGDALLVIDADRQRATAVAVPYARDDHGTIRFQPELPVGGDQDRSLAAAVPRVLRHSVPFAAARVYPSMLESVGHTVLDPVGVAQLARGPRP